MGKLIIAMKVMLNESSSHVPFPSVSGLCLPSRSHITLHIAVNDPFGL